MIFGHGKLVASNKGKSTNIIYTYNNYITKKYELIDFKGKIKPAADLFKRGMIGFMKLKNQGKVKSEILTLIDFRLSSNKKRMWVIDLENNKLLYHTLVAHGKNTGNEYAKSFSNIVNSNQSSLGFYLTGETYKGKHGLSLRLDGMEQNINHRARERAIVIHGASYVHEDYSKKHGRIGRSFGCPAIPMEKHTEIINKLADKSCVFIYFPSPAYLNVTKLGNENPSYTSVR
jgi:hypothetical protein